MSKEMSRTTRASIEASKKIQQVLAHLKKKSEKELPYMQVKS